MKQKQHMTTALHRIEYNQAFFLLLSSMHLYGMDSSPWTQAVMLALHAKDIPYKLSGFPNIPIIQLIK